MPYEPPQRTPSSTLTACTTQNSVAVELRNDMRTKTPKTGEAGCCDKPALKDRPLLSPIQAGGLAAVFKVLANDTRLRLLHALVRADELCVTDLAASLGMKP